MTELNDEKVAGAVQIFHRFSNCAAGHVTTFEAAVHGFGSAACGTLGKLRKQVATAKGTATAPKNPHRLRLGKKHGVPPKSALNSVSSALGLGFFWDPKLRAFAVKFPGSDASVVRHSQDAIAAAPPSGSDDNEGMV